MKILFVAADPKPERWTSLIQQHLPEADIQVWHPDLPSCGADYAIVWHPPAALFDKEPQLKAVFNLGAGVDALVQVPNLQRDIPVVRLEDAGMSVQMAEYVAYHVIGISRDMDAYREQQAAGQWKLRRPIERSEWPVGVLGLGHIGQRVARTLAVLDYPVSGWARSAHTLEGVRSFAGTAELDRFLGETRVLVNTLPLTDSTRDLIDYSLLAKLKPVPSSSMSVAVSMSSIRTCAARLRRAAFHALYSMCSAKSRCQPLTRSGRCRRSPSPHTYRLVRCARPRLPRLATRSLRLKKVSPSAASSTANAAIE